LNSPFLRFSLSPIKNKKAIRLGPYGCQKEKAMGPDQSPMASIPPSGLDLWVTFPKVKIKEAKVEHFYDPQVSLYDISGWICQGKYDLMTLAFPGFSKHPG